MKLHRAGQADATASMAGPDNETLFTSRAQARIALKCWRAVYNDARLAPRMETPSELASCQPRRDLALRYAWAPRQLPSPANGGSLPIALVVSPIFNLLDRVRDAGQS